MRCRLAILVALFAAAACSTSNSSVDSSPIGPTPAPVGSSFGPTVTVDIPAGASALRTAAFGANPLVVSVGTTIVWRNNDTIAHTSTADTNGWNSGTIAPGQSFQFAFTSIGTFSYHCSIHPDMIGRVTVQ